MLKEIFLLLNLLFAPIFLLGGDVSFVANSSKTRVAIGEQFQITFTLNTSGTNFKAPSFANFQFLGGPSQSTSMQIINGNMSQSISYTYYLAGKNPGKFTIEPASIVVNGKKIESNSVTIEVTKDQVPQNQSSTRNNPNYGGYSNPNQYGSINEKELADNVFLKAVPSKNNVLQGEPLSVTYKLYRRIDVIQYQVKEMPKYNGFWKEEINIDNQTYTESIDGIQYAVTDIKRVVLIPQRSGQLTVDPLDIDVIIRLKSRRSNSFFDDFFGIGSYQNYNLPLKSRPLTVFVKPLPGNAPSDFTGIVGNLSVSAKLSRNKVKANESVTLKVVVSGKGNLKMIEPFKLNVPEEIEVYEPKINANISVSTQGITGTKTFEYLLIPRGGGQFKIDPITLSYFDAQQNQYKTIATESYTLEVSGEPATNAQSFNQPQLVRKEDIKVKTNDIAYIKTNTKLEPINNYFFGSTLFNLMCFIIIGSASGYLVYENKMDKKRMDVKYYRSSRALKNALQILKEAQKNATNSNVFYQHLSNSIYQYIGDKFNVGLANATLDLIKDAVEKKSPNSMLYKQLKSITETCEMARFALIQTGVEKEKLINETEAVLKQIDELIV